MNVFIFYLCSYEIKLTIDIIEEIQEICMDKAVMIAHKNKKCLTLNDDFAYIEYTFYNTE